MLDRRSLITGLISFVAAPAIVRAESLMNIKSSPRMFIGMDYGRDGFTAVAVTVYNPFDGKIHVLDILYGKLTVKQDWITNG